MKELFDKFERISLKDASNLNLIDTCFFISIFEHPKKIKRFEKLKNKSITSFNVSELINVEHRLHNNKHQIRKFLEKSEDIIILDVGVEPGEWEKEKMFVEKIQPKILKYCKDASDAVLLAAAIATNSNILTKDKHHMFNAAMENFAEKNNIEVYKELKDAL